ncbi:hypothetical protein EDD11_005161 [Mortierella claussenii]|nr:hypothetical protein EDD11_005161 [Mortierella claussenii]
MLSERKKVLALLDKRQSLEDQYASQPTEILRAELDSLTPQLLHYFSSTTLESLLEQFPTTAAMKAFAEKKRYFAPRRKVLQSLNAADLPHGQAQQQPSSDINQQYGRQQQQHQQHQRNGAMYENLRRTGTNQDYLEFVRVSKSVFMSIASSVLEQHQVFKNHSNNGQESVEKQLAVTLWRLGHHGKNAGIGDASKVFGLSEGTIVKCTHRCLQALRDISVDVILWPAQGDKSTVKKRIMDISTTVAATAQVSPSSGSKSGTRPSTCTNRGGGIADAVGILSSMRVFLVSKPLLKNTEEYLIPLHPRALSSIKSLTAGNQKNSRAKSKTGGRLSRTQSSETPELLETVKHALVNATDDSTTDQETMNKRLRGKQNEPVLVEVEDLSATRHIKHKGKSLEIGTQDMAPGSAEFMVSHEETVILCAANASEGPSIPALPCTDDTSATPLPTWSSSSPKAAIPPERAVKKTRTRPASFVKTAYFKRDYGYNILIACDSTTRIRYAELSRPAAWTDQRVLASSPLVLERAKYFQDDDYLVASSSFSPSGIVVPLYTDQELQSVDPAIYGTGRDNPSAGQAHVEAKKKFNNALSSIQKRAMDCQRKLKARFPSLLEMRVQIKDDDVGTGAEDESARGGGSQESARNWILACMTIHNLVLGDNLCYNQKWEDQLEVLEKSVLEQQEVQARLIWKYENMPSKRLSKSLVKGTDGYEGDEGVSLFSAQEAAQDGHIAGPDSLDVDDRMHMDVSDDEEAAQILVTNSISGERCREPSRTEDEHSRVIDAMMESGFDTGNASKPHTGQVALDIIDNHKSGDRGGGIGSINSSTNTLALLGTTIAGVSQAGPETILEGFEDDFGVRRRDVLCARMGGTYH